MRQMLVVDNYSAISKEICDSMRDSLTEVHFVTSAAEAMVWYMERDYHLVILDIQCMDMDVIEMLQTMRNTKIYRFWRLLSP